MDFQTDVSSGLMINTSCLTLIEETFSFSAFQFLLCQHFAVNTQYFNGKRKDTIVK